MKKVYLLLTLVSLITSGFAQTTIFNFTGSVQTYVVPAGVNALGIDMMGGAGGAPYMPCGGSGVSISLGGRVQCHLAVTPGQTLYVYVGGLGQSDGNACTGQAGNAVTGGWNGGVNAVDYVGASGGASDIRTTSNTTYSNRLVVAGGGGAGGDYYGEGGPGGGTTGGAGTVHSGYFGTGGSGGTQTGPGPSGCHNGTLGVGGASQTFGGGGGGGGWWGGNGGCSDGGGGGGSSYTDPTLCTSVVHTQGYSGANGNGQVTITVLCGAVGTIAGPSTVCSGQTITLTNTGGPSNWFSSNTSVATIDNATGVLTGVAAGVVTIIDSAVTPCGGLSARTTVTVNVSPSPITGTLSTCPSGTSTLTSSPGGGTWTSGNVFVATIGSSSGVVTSAITGSGTSTITYSIGNGCPNATAVFTLNPNPAAITGTGTVCGGSVPTSLTLGDATTGGTWSSSNVGLATVGSTGIVTGVSAGTPTISYVMPTGCLSTSPITVNAVGNILGSSSICVGTSETLTDVTSGGVWSSSAPAVGSITAGGVVTGVSIGSTNITYNVSSLGCSAAMLLNVTSSSLSSFTVTGGGTYCAGGTGLHVGLSGSTSGVTYSLFNGGTLVTTAVGTGSALDFGLITGTGSYTVVANYGSACSLSMAGSVTINTNPLPTSFSVSAGGTYCFGGAGLHVTLNSSTVGVNYQLMLGGITPVGSAMPGTGTTLDFGAQTTAGTYTVVATNATTGCSTTMSGSAVITINPLPTAFTVTGGGGYCTGGTGLHVGLSSSTSGINYQLLLGGSPVGSIMTGTGAALDFGIFTSSGTYTVVATNTSTGCTATMASSAVITINPLPAVYSMTGGGTFCNGGTGVAVGLNNSTSGVNYQLYIGTIPTGAPVAGTGVALSFGLQTVGGSYTAVATNAVTGCVNNMSGTAVVTVNPPPQSFALTGGGSYCAGGSGVPVGIAGSVVGTNYYLYCGTTLVGAAPGTGGPMSFGLQTLAGTYTINATNTLTGCSGAMNSSITITINPLPGAFNVTGGGSFCAGGTGVPVQLSGSASGINYQLYNGTTAVGSPVAGTGSVLSFGSQTVGGTYTITAVNPTTTCSISMLGSAMVVVNPLPTPYAVTGGGGFCTGGTGLHIGLASSNSGINYQLYNTGGLVGAAVAGTGSALDFGVFTAVGTYSVTAVNPSTTCTGPMAGSAVVTVNSLPAAFAVTGGGAYCFGGSGVHVGLFNSVTGVSYQLFNGLTPAGSPVGGTGSAIDFGAQTAAGTYTAVATVPSTSCANNMTGSATISINPLPTSFLVTGGGNYCTGGTGVHVGLSGSASGVSYQLMNGGVAVTSLIGTGTALDFGLQTAVGPYTVVATNPTTTCTATMTGTVTVATLSLPPLSTVTGGGAYCTGGTGVHVGINTSVSGFNYQLLLGGSPVGVALPGTGAAIDFGLHTAGAYTVQATNATTGCQSNMTGSATITANPLPVLHSVMGGGSFCSGGTGVTVGLDGSNLGTDYQLFNGAIPVGAPVSGTGSIISFGLETSGGVYTVTGTNATTGCTTLMTGTATVGVNPLPTAFNVTGGGNYCSGGTGLHVGLAGSSSGVSYQLWNGTSPVGASVPGTGSALDFGLQTNAGSYTVKAINPLTGCVNNMAGAANIVVSPLPPVHTVTGGGDYCAGGAGVHVGINGSDVGSSYQLYYGGVSVGSSVLGTGLAIDFGVQASAGSYSVIATTTGSTCTSNMAGSVNVIIDPLPSAYTVIGGGNYCSGGTGADIILNNSDPGVTYQLYRGTTPVSAPMGGTGLPLDFGLQTLAGTYTVVGTNTLTTCSGPMSNSVVITINPLPTVFTVGGGGNYCSGGAGMHVTLSGSSTGVNYQLYYGASPVGVAVAGTGSALDFGVQTAVGVYTVKATNASTTCTNSMAGSATIGINPLPAVYSLNSAGSSYCAGGAGIDVKLSGSDIGTSYQLYNSGAPLGTPMPGTSGVLDFGNQTAGGAYTVVATNGTGCTANMSSTVSIVVNPLPTAYAVTGGGGYCIGGSGVHVGVAGSDLTVSYQLFKDGAPLGTLTGTSGTLDFGLQTAGGNYTVVATNTVSGCFSSMTGAAVVAVNTLPTVFTVTGGGNYCAGGAGEHVYLSNSTSGVNYQLYRNGTLTVGSPVAGSGGSLDFGAQTTAGTYTVVAANATTGCSSNMGSSAVVGINATPTVYPVVGGGSYCSGGTGLHIGTGGSTAGISYQLFQGLSPLGVPVIGTGSGLDFGAQTSAGTYTIVATNMSTGCTSSMSGTATININPLPSVYPVVGGGSYCAGGSGAHVGLSNSATGVNYTLLNGFSTISTKPGVGGPLDFGAETGAGTYTVHAVNATTGCAANMSGSVNVSITPIVSPFVSVSMSSSDTVCEGTFITFTANPTNGGTAPTYQWDVNGVPSGSAGTYAYVPANGDVINVTLTSNAVCASPTSANASVTMTVNPKAYPGVSVSANPGTVVCQGTSVTFTANAVYGGNAPAYSWVKNGSVVGSSSTFTYTPANGDVLNCTLTSNYTCRLSNTVTSGDVSMEVDVPTTPVVTVLAHPGTNIPAGATVTFSASATGAGSAPTYQWVLNGSNVPGATNASYTTGGLQEGDVVGCNVTSSGGCAGMMGVGSVTIHVIGVGVKPVSSTNADIKLIPNPNKGAFMLKGTLGTLADQEVSVEITDMVGQVVYSTKMIANNGEVNQRIELGGTVANGMYIVSLRSGADIQVYHMVIEQ